MTRARGRGVWAVAPFLLVLALLVTDAQIDFESTIADIRGVPSTPLMAYSRRRVIRSDKLAARQRTQRAQETQSALEAAKTALRELESASRMVREGLGADIDPKVLAEGMARCSERDTKLRSEAAGARARLAQANKQLAGAKDASRKRQILATIRKMTARMQVLAREIQKNGVRIAQLRLQEKQVAESFVRVVPMQTLRVRVVTPSGTPVPRLPMVVRIASKDGDVEKEAPATTDGDGYLLVEKAGPLPALLSIALASEPAQEWRLQKAEVVAITIDRPMGTKVASRRRSKPVASRQATGDSGRSERIEVYAATAEESVVVERTVVDLSVAARPGTRVSSATLGDQALVVPETGVLECRVPASSLAGGPVPIRFCADLPGGEAEAVVTRYTCDPYKMNHLECPVVRLVRLSSVEPARQFDVLQSREVAQSLLSRKPDRIAKLSDGSEWWDCTRDGVFLQVRRTPFMDGKNNRAVVERVRIVSKQGGSVAGLSVGADARLVEQGLGAPEIVVNEADSAPTGVGGSGMVQQYLDRGFAVCVEAGVVKWMEIRRPKALLRDGTTAFAQPVQCKVYVERFTANNEERTLINDRADLARYLRRVPALAVVDDPDDADMLLSVEARYRAVRGSVFNLIPYRYEAITELIYSATAPSGDPLLKDRKAVGKSSADYTRDYSAAAAMVAAATAMKKGNLRDLALAAAAAQAARAVDMTRRAVNRCPAASASEAFNEMATDLSRAVHFTARVTEINRTAGTVRLSVGSRAGVFVSSEDEPFRFVLMVSGNMLPEVKDRNGTKTYVAEVVDVGDDHCWCALRAVQRKVNRGFVEMAVTPSPTLGALIPDPVSGVISGSAWVGFPPIQVVAAPSPDSGAVVFARIRSAPGRNRFVTARSRYGGAL